MTQPETIPPPARLHLSSHLANSSPSVISRTTTAVADRKNQGHRVLSIHVGEPDFDTPQYVKEAGIAAILGNDTHYTAMDGLITDDIYEHLVYDGVRFVTPLQVRPGLRDRTVTVNGVSKAYAMTGWRIGYGAGPEKLMHAMRTILSQSTSCPSSVSRAAAAAALRGPQDAVEDYRRQYAARREIVVGELNSIPGLDCVTPEGAFYAFPSWKPLIGHVTPDGERLETDEQFCRYLLHDFGVAVIPGAPFGAPGHFRISYAAAQPILLEAMTRLRTACGALAAKRPVARRMTASVTPVSAGNEEA